MYYCKHLSTFIPKYYPMITIVGGIPEPVGGITNYLYRLTIHFNSHIDQVLDLYPSAKKWRLLNVPLHVRPATRLKTLLWLFRQFSNLNSQVIYFNFSGPGSLFLLEFLPKRCGSAWYLTLHHGELEIALQKKGILGRFLFHKAVRCFDSIGYINAQQKDFYLNHGVSEYRLKKIITYLPYVSGKATSDPIFEENLQMKVKEIRARYRKIVVASGYPTALYRHDWVLDYFEKHDFYGGAVLFLCLYGADNEGQLKYLKKWAERLPNVYLFESLSPGQFQSVLTHSDIYVRPTEKDSYGVAVAEAIHLGLTVLASDACERAAGVHLLNRFDRDSFDRMLDDAIHERLKSCQDVQDNGIECIAAFLGVHS